MLVYDAVKLRNSNAVGGTELFYGLLQIVGRNTAHFHSTGTGNGACSQIKVKQLCNGFCILAVHFKEISDLIQHYIVRVHFFDGIVVQNKRSGGRLHVLRFWHKRYLFALDWLGYA